MLLMHILIIDDDQGARDTMAAFVAGDGTSIIAAENGRDGIVRAKDDRPDLVLLDLMMPGLGGHEVLERLKDDPATSAIPVVVITSRFINDDEKSQVMGRANGVLYKGDLSRETVTLAIDRALDHQR